MKAVKIGLGALIMLIIALVCVLLITFFQRLIVWGAEFANGLGDTLIIMNEDELAPDATEDLYSKYYRQNTAQPYAPSGDDPSWGEDMPQAPVDKTAEQLAEEADAEKRTP